MCAVQNTETRMPDACMRDRETHLYMRGGFGLGRGHIVLYV